jgi:serine/threonine protein kinase
MLKVLRQMADALDYTHARGVIHRDIKPANVMIDSTGTTKIMDFGIARITDTRTCTPTGMVMGTVEYMAPEQILGVNMDGRADQFALAVVAYQMMTGSTLFGPNTVATLTYKIVNEAAAAAAHTQRGASARGGRGTGEGSLAKKPADRFATCSEFAAALADKPFPMRPPLRWQSHGADSRCYGRDNDSGTSSYCRLRTSQDVAGAVDRGCHRRSGAGGRIGRSDPEAVEAYAGSPIDQRGRSHAAGDSSSNHAACDGAGRTARHHGAGSLETHGWTNAGSGDSSANHSRSSGTAAEAAGEVRGNLLRAA